MNTEQPIKIVTKGWGHEKWIVNTEEYCGKLLFFEDLSKANTKILEPGDTFHIYRGLRHQMYAMEHSELFEFSTQHFDTDSYRIMVGD